MLDLQCQDRCYLLSSTMAKHRNLGHAFTGRLGGVSQGKIRGLNLGFRVGDSHDAVMENYRLVAEDLGFSPERTVLSRQTHTDHIRIVTETDAGKGLTVESDIQDTDGLITDCPNLALVVFSADCIPLLFYDPVRRVVGAVHAGWRGTVKGIAGKAVQMMQEHFHCHPEDILAAIGPGIGPCCFAFGKEAPQYFPTSFLKEEEDGSYLVDLWAMNQKQLTDQGVLLQNIEVSGHCTVCRADRYYSYRTHKEQTGRQGAIIFLKESSEIL